MTGTLFTLEAQPEIPERLSRLHELANDLYYSWDRHSRGLFFYLDRELWEECQHNPKVFLRRVSQQRLEKAVKDRAFLEEYQRTLANYDTYQEEVKRLNKVQDLDTETDLIAYFCAEFGLHESLPVYSGGLGILAGDYCKAASDLGIPFLAVGLLYRQGNLSQTIDDYGNQVSHYNPVNLMDLPIQPAKTQDGKDLFVTIELPKTRLSVKVWRVKAGHTDIYLLDTDVRENSVEDRAITYQIYPSDPNIRFQQEIILGIGGARALDSLDLSPTVWHINEGHPCLQIVERCRKLVAEGLKFRAALELVASGTVFTTHTPVPAGHEVYETDLIANYLSGFIDELGIKQEEFFAMGQNGDKNGFNMTTFSIHGSRFHNGVSRIHGDIASEMEKSFWCDIPVEDNPMGYVTNGVHVQTFLAREWVSSFDDPGWRNELLNTQYWDRIDAIPDASFWSIRRTLKNNLFKDCCSVIKQRCRRHGHSQAQIQNEIKILSSKEDVLVLGFARRFATYKRATLMFDDLDRLERLLNDPQRPVIMFFAGKAHPTDEPGKDLIRRIHELSRESRFHGKVFLLEGYDLSLARKLVTGVDIWVNTPEYPMEACGTSGMKAAINGVMNLSILDGWWAEGYNGNNGWGIHAHSSEPDHNRRRWLENKELLDTLEYEVIPMYFDKTLGYSEAWVKMAKDSMKSIIPRFNSQRMVMDYIEKFYVPAIRASKKLAEKNCEPVKALAQWKRTINKKWSGVSIRRFDDTVGYIQQGKEMTIRVAVTLNGLHSKDVHVECLFGRVSDSAIFDTFFCHLLEAKEERDGEMIYELTFTPEVSGLVSYKLRAYPYQKNLCHHFETGYMKWV